MVLRREKHELQMRGARMENMQEEKLEELRRESKNLKKDMDALKKESLEEKNARRRTVDELVIENGVLNLEISKVFQEEKYRLALQRQHMENIQGEKIEILNDELRKIRNS